VQCVRLAAVASSRSPLRLKASNDIAADRAASAILSMNGEKSEYYETRTPSAQMGNELRMPRKDESSRKVACPLLSSRALDDSAVERYASASEKECSDFLFKEEL
jgi:hypothetical protein